MKRYLLAVGILLSAFSVNAQQVGGSATSQILNLAPSARVAGLGGVSLAVKDNDVNVALWNPSLLNSEMDNHLSISTADYLTDINLSAVGFTKHFDSVGTFSLGLKYINYGDFLLTNEIGDILGNFTGNEFVVTAGYGYQIDSAFSVGANLKYIGSTFETYHSAAIATDLGASYLSKNKRTTVSLLFKNIGFQTKAFTEGNEENLPFEIQLGISSKFAHAPFRWHVILQNLERPDLTFDNPTTAEFDPISGQRTNDDANVAEKIVRHVVFGVEFVPTRSFNLRFGYNFRRQQEMKLTTRRSNAGISWGVGIRISKFYLDYGRATYHVSGSTNHFSVSTRFADFKKKKTPPSE